MRGPDPLYQHHLGEDQQLPLHAVGGRVRHPLPAVQHPRCVHTCQARSPLLGQQQQRRDEDRAENRINSKYNRFNSILNPPATTHSVQINFKFKIKLIEMCDVKCSSSNVNFSLNTQKSFSYPGDPSSNPVSHKRERSHLPRSPGSTKMEGNRRKREERSLVGWLNQVIVV